MSKGLSAKYYQENKTTKKARAIYQNEGEKGKKQQYACECYKNLPGDKLVQR